MAEQQVRHVLSNREESPCLSLSCVWRAVPCQQQGQDPDLAVGLLVEERVHCADLVILEVS